MTHGAEKFEERALILAHEGMAEHTLRLRLRAPKIAALARPGQFAMLRVSQAGEPLLRRPFSFHRIVPERGEIEILYKVVGRGTGLLASARPGTETSLIGPLGNGFTLAPKREGPLVFVAGGIGIAPIHALMEAAAAAPALAARAVLLYGARTATELLPASALSPLRIPVHIATDDGSAGTRGYVTTLLDALFGPGEPAPAALFACGALAMQVNVARWAKGRGVPAQLSLESLMACGFGACLGCALPAADPPGTYVHVCTGGPIFSAESIAWEHILSQQAVPRILQYA